MNKTYSIAVAWIFVLVMATPGTTVMAEDPVLPEERAAREARPSATAKGGVAPGPEFPLFEPMPPPPAERQETKAATYGIVSTAGLAGGKFSCLSGSGVAYLGHGATGITAMGSQTGGYFEDTDGTSSAYVANSGFGVVAAGTWFGITGDGAEAGGVFNDTNGSGYAMVAHGDNGISGHGTNAGGVFYGSGSSGRAFVGYGDSGIEAFGNAMGGYFKDANQSGQIRAAYGDYGLQAYGNLMGGLFDDSNASGLAYVAYGDIGIRAYGNTYGGHFDDTNGSGVAYVAYGDVGIEGRGFFAGGVFFDSNHSGHANVGTGDFGIWAEGSYAGAYFNDSNSTSWAQVGYGAYKILGTGAVSFVQNHPYKRDEVIVYAAPEGDEVATYTRGSARLIGGEVRVPLGETFRWVTNPDVGLTAFLTPMGNWCDLYVVEQATDSIVVRSRDGSDCSFNYMVYGLRIGFEESSIVQEKEMESYIPSMADHRKLYERRPDLKSYNSLERFKGMHHAINPKAELDLSQAHALRDAIIEFDPAVHELPKHPAHEARPEDDLALEEAQRGEVQTQERVRVARGDHDRRPATDQSDLSAAIPVDDEGNVYATSFRPSSQDLASLVDVSEEVQPGDVLVIDRDNPGMTRKAFEAHDTGVIGVVALDAGVVVGTQPPATEVIKKGTAPSHRAAVGLAGFVTCNVDAAYGAVWPGDLLVTSPTPGHAMRADAPHPGTTLGKALEPLKEGVGTIKVMVMLR